LIKNEFIFEYFIVLFQTLRNRKKSLKVKTKERKEAKMEQLETSTSTVKTLTPKELAKRMGISDKRVRSILRSSIQRDAKHKSWQVTPEQAKQVIKDYKAEVKEREAKKQAKIKNELEGKE
jgi:hypothetical protein